MSRAFAGPTATSGRGAPPIPACPSRIAALHGIDLTAINGTGPRGRISKADVLALAPQPAAAPVGFGTPEFVAGENRPTVQPFDRIRKVVARRLTEALENYFTEAVTDHA